jgi:hypothetical protein
MRDGAAAEAGLSRRAECDPSFSYYVEIMIKTTLGLLLVATVASASAQDSPLVALAKRTNRKAPKTTVITNETVAAASGRLSMPAGDASKAAAPATSSTARPEAQVNGASVQTVAPPPAAKAKAQPQTAEQPRRTTVRNIQPESTARNLDPASSARNIQPESTVRNVQPESSARNVEPATTARNIEPASTARNIEPETNTPPR